MKSTLFVILMADQKNKVGTTTHLRKALKEITAFIRLTRLCAWTSHCKLMEHQMILGSPTHLFKGLWDRANIVALF